MLSICAIFDSIFFPFVLQQELIMLLLKLKPEVFQVLAGYIYWGEMNMFEEQTCSADKIW